MCSSSYYVLYCTGLIELGRDRGDREEERRKSPGPGRGLGNLPVGGGSENGRLDSLLLPQIVVRKGGLCTKGGNQFPSGGRGKSGLDRTLNLFPLSVEMAN